MDKKPWDLMYEAAQMLLEDWISGESSLFDGERDCMSTIAVIRGIATDLRMRDPKELERFGERHGW